MEYAFSLRQSRLLHARAVSYDGCCELPACHEALFKRGNSFTKREYFCHYTAQLGASCELRCTRDCKKGFCTERAGNEKAKTFDGLLGSRVLSPNTWAPLHRSHPSRSGCVGEQAFAG